MLIFDIGANVGNWSKENINNCDKIIAIEPQSDVYEELKKTCANKNIICLNYAVCNNDCKDIIFYQSNCNQLSSLNKEWFTNPTSRFYNRCSFQSIICKSITIDKLIEEYGKPDLIKIDVESGEYTCIISLTQKVNCLCFEWASEVNEITFACMDYLLTLGFTNFYIQFEDNYLFRPDENSYYSIEETKKILLNTTPREHWGMIWCK